MTKTPNLPLTICLRIPLAARQVEGIPPAIEHWAQRGYLLTTTFQIPAVDGPGAICLVFVNSDFGSVPAASSEPAPEVSGPTPTMPDDAGTDDAEFTGPGNGSGHVLPDPEIIR